MIVVGTCDDLIVRGIEISPGERVGRGKETRLGRKKVAKQRTTCEIQILTHSCQLLYSVQVKYPHASRLAIGHTHSHARRYMASGPTDVHFHHTRPAGVRALLSVETTMALEHSV